ncbi:MAG TPA: tannase/feruloyl esterase family alpha/beta hydrolase, partial [Candidatus Bathyarchaeia archaeon]|nr:tannase/feruloyl esterase family alpha/beta hydrolase [Candidatus Bathyarchaeia archaeon]
AGPWILPNASPNDSTNVPAFCRVVANIWPEVRFELWLPEHWNGKFLAVGNGGLAGSINYRDLLEPLRRGYAVASTDTGHQGNGDDGSWALGHMQRVVDFAYRGIHITTEAAKAITADYYGAMIAHSYFQGCSQGGRQALILAQRFPADYDGIIAGSPANNWTRHYVGGHLWIALAMEGPGYLSPAKINLLGEAVKKQCDALDGVSDGVLNDPRRCHFDPSFLECKTADGPNCLTSAQVASLKKIYGGLRDDHGHQLYPGLMPGGEEGPGGWTWWVAGTQPGKSGHAGLGIPFLKYVAFEDANWDYHTFRFTRSDGLDNDVHFTDQKLGALYNATDPDLRAFRDRGGKLIQYHGWSDPDITPLSSVNYYEGVVSFMGRGSSNGLRFTQDFYRLFMVPGMQHCGGGEGTDHFQMLDELEVWVEKGKAPDRIIASHLTDGKVDRTRPLCPYPKEARWTKSGSTDDAANFQCVVPD